MNKMRYRLMLILVLVCAKSIVNAQVLPKIQQAFDSYYGNVFQEKIFVHTDKEAYVTGELLWFKVYNVDAATNAPANLSKVAYVEILDQKNNQLLQAKVELKAGSGNGSFYVPITITNGTYKLRAYTNWMQNFGPENFFEKKITLLNPQKTTDKTVASNSEQDLQFFPEGGYLVSGITSKVGFRTVGADGNGIAIKGIIINQKNDTVARFQSLKFGIGQFTFTPAADQTYKAVATSEKGEILIKQLPAVKAKGYAMMLTAAETSNPILTIGTNLNVGQVYLVANNGKTITQAEAAKVENGKAVFQLKKEQLHDGLTYLTLFNEEGIAVCERLFFKRPTKKLTIDAFPDYLQYTTRKDVTVNIVAKNEKEEPQLADLSIAVHLLDSLQAGMAEQSMLSYIWLQSELKGKIESPDFYFGEENNETNLALDNLLITQGWRRFNWDPILKDGKPSFKFLPEVNGHLISGSVTKPNGSVAQNTKVYLSVPGKRVQFYASESDSTGNFKFNTKDFYGVNELVLQTDYTIDSTSVISIKSPFSQQFSAFNYPDLAIKPTFLNALKVYNLSVQVQNAYTGSKLKQFYDPGADSTSFYGNPFKTYRLDDYTRFATMEEVLREYIREVFVSKKQKNFHLKILGSRNLLYGDPLVLLDGVPYFNIDRAMMLDPMKIERLEVVNQSYFYGSSLFEGVLSFFSYKGNLADIPLDPKAIVLDYEGMQLQREFYVPRYETPEQLSSRIPDFRNQLLWSPQITLDKNAKAKLNFYTSDQVGTYIGVVEGITIDGVPGTKTFTFEVKK